MTEKKVAWGKVLTFSGAIVAYLIGSGFASGQEALQFYAVFGVRRGLMAFAVSFVVFCWFEWRVMEDGRQLQLDQPAEIFEFYCGKILGKFYKVFTAVVLFALFVVMISGSGAIMHEYYGISRYLGSLVMACAVLLTVIMGLDGIVNVIGRIGPVIIVIALSVGFLNIVGNFGQLKYADETLASVVIPMAASHWLLAAMLYAALCVIVSVPFLAGMGASAPSGRETLYGGVLGGFSVVLGMMVVAYGMLASIGEVYHLQAPAIGVADIVHPGLGILYSAVVVVGIYTTAVPMLWTPCKTINSDEKSKTFRTLAVIGSVIGFFGGQLHFSTLVNIVFPFCGSLGLLLTACIALKHLRLRKAPSLFVEEVSAVEEAVDGK